ncbi:MULTISPECIES: ABC transporter permease [Rhizobium]|uniref:ABC transporter permease n=1 Tax=Rhizobium TaxID=379 RepID=UPI001B32E6EE|nr:MULTISPECIES: ABC transporter permease [Rhizobium]MBX4910759.1 ABC transporter permease [Rhizobium bangladeshense]MBX5218327.1 ABC transporter permease [Rhizobium sp. NLR9a]MBX5229729.1 ABC transporter permease [Rhizobium sp. NLR9b]MBX5236051.1 ABC transporter permease [Rhizobium sp. NLR4a]MBX5241522.1 ABC transporter permease [Rhizobium sp. NLR22b]
MIVRLLKSLYGAATVIFLLAPLLAILPIAFTSSSFLAYPIPSFSTRWFAELANEDAWRRSIVNSLLIGTGTTLLSTVLGMLASLALRRRIVFGSTLRTMFLLPMVVPAVVLGVGLQILFAKLGFPNTFAAVIIAHTVVAVPFVLISITASLEGIDYRVERAATSLGASPAKVFWKVTLPLAMPGVLSGAVLAFATSLDEVVLTLFVAGPNQLTLARQMFSSIRENISPAIVAAAFLFILGTVFLGGLLAVVHKRAARSTIVG